MKKKSLNLTISENLIRKGREYNINFSSFLEMKLVEYIAIKEGILKNFKQQPNETSSDKYSLNMIRQEVDSLYRKSKSKHSSLNGKSLNHSSYNQGDWACSLDWIGRQPPKL